MPKDRGISRAARGLSPDAQKIRQIYWDTMNGGGSVSQMWEDMAAAVKDQSDAEVEDKED